MQLTVRPDVRAFFERYQRAARDLDTEALMSSFAENFLSLDSGSAHALTPERLIAALPSRQARFEKHRSDGMELDQIDETPLDELHTLVRTSWMLRRRADLPPITAVFDVRAARRGGNLAHRPLSQPPGHGQALEQLGLRATLIRATG